MDRPLSLPRFFLRLVRFTPWAYGASLALVVFFLAARLVPGLVLQRLYDGLTGAAPADLNVLSLLGLYVGVEAARAASHFSAGFPRAAYFQTSGMLLTKNALRLILERPGALPLPVTPGDAVNRLDDDVAESAHFMLWLPEVIGHGLFFAAAFVILLRVNATITLIVTLPLVLVVAMTNALRDRYLAAYADSRAAAGEVTSFLGELFGAVQAVKVAGAEADVIAHFGALNERRRAASLRYRLLDETQRWLSNNVADLAVGLVLLLSGRAIRAGTFTVGDFSLFVTYLWFLTRFPATFGGFLADYRTQQVSVERLLGLTAQENPAELVEATPVYRSGPLPAIHRPAASPSDRLRILRVSGLSYAHPGGQGLQNVDFSLQSGMLTVVTGQVGGGKTTLLRTLLGLLPRDAGEIYWNDAPVDEPATFFVPPRCAYVPQVPRLFSQPLRDNIVMGLPEEEVDLVGALETAVLGPDLTQLAQGLDTVVGPRGVKLSGGQVQRAAAARAFVHRPALLVFDDLSSALDVETEKVLWERLLDVPERPTILAVSHRRPVLQRADKILLLKDGALIGDGRLPELLERSPEMARIWEGRGAN